MSHGDVVNVQTFLNENRFSPYQWIIFTLCFLIVLLDGFDTAAIGYIAPSLISEWGIERAALAPVLSAALFGLSLGAMVAGPLSDRFGRKVVLTGSVFIFGAACLISGFSSGLTELVVWRFITGIGLGAAMPNAVTLMSEYCPDDKRATITNAMFCGFPLGATVGGILAAWMIPAFGWRSVLYLGGLVPLLLVILLLMLLPESVRILVKQKNAAEKIRSILQRISSSALKGSTFVVEEKSEQDSKSGGVRLVLSRDYIVGSVMLWTAYFMGLVIFYALINWMPVLFRDAGLTAAQAALVTALFPLGGLGAIVAGRLMDRMNANVIIAVCFVLTALSIYAIGQSTAIVSLLTVVVLVAGTLMNTAQSSLPALAASFYPTQGRATGVAWMMALGRVGGIAGSFLVAELARRSFTLEHVFMVMAVPSLIAAAALVVKQLAHPSQ